MIFFIKAIKNTFGRLCICPSILADQNLGLIGILHFCLFISVFFDHFQVKRGTNFKIGCCRTMCS
jgi:hypothetical protein